MEMPDSKYKGKKVVDVKDYANWALSADFPEDTNSIIRNLISN